MGEHGDPLGCLSKEEIRDLLGKGWLTHDGMWFVAAAAELGIERANSLNRAAIRSMAHIEVRRLVEAFGVDRDALATSDAFCPFLAGALAVLLPESVSSRIRVSVVDSVTLRLEWGDGECFAYKGMRRVGLLDGYDCGVIFRIECWLEELGIRCEIEPPVGRCRMKLDGGCATEFRFLSGS